VFDAKPFQTSGNVYKNPKAPIHLMIGSAGAFLDNLITRKCASLADERDYMAHSETNYGFGRMNIFNETHLNFQFHRTNGKVSDEMWIIKE
jgi:hypothetical protein